MTRYIHFSFFLWIIIISMIASSCVSSKKYKMAVFENQRIDSLNRLCNDRVANLSTQVSGLETDTTKLGADVRDLIERYNVLLSQSLSKEELLSKELQEKRQKLQEYETFLADREQRVQELQSLIRRKDSLTNALLTKVRDALTGFSQEELSVNIRNGRVYVSLSEQLLFPSGSYVVNQKGKDAIDKLAEVLAKNPDIQVMIEGHTDNKPIKTNCIRDNWDLSVLRATSVVNILVKNASLLPERLVACGRGEYQPVAPNSSVEGRQSNRRTEIILTPKLVELFTILEGQ